MSHEGRPAATETKPGRGEQPGGSRWVLVGAGLLLPFSIGAVYAWSVFAAACR